MKVKLRQPSSQSHITRRGLLRQRLLSHGHSTACKVKAVEAKIDVIRGLFGTCTERYSLSEMTRCGQIDILGTLTGPGMLAMTHPLI